MKVQHFLLTGIAVAVLSACGSDNNSKSKPETQIQPEETVEKAGRLLGAGEDVSKATVFYDMNGDMEPNDGEAVSPVSAEGDYKLNVKKSNEGKGVLTAAMQVSAHNCFYNPESACGVKLTSSKDEGVISGLTSMHRHVKRMYKDKNYTDAQATQLMKQKFDLNESPFTDYEKALKAPSLAPEREMDLRQAMRIDAAFQATLRRFTTPSEVNINIGSVNIDVDANAEVHGNIDVHNTILHHLMSDSGIEMVIKAIKLHKAHEDYAQMDYGSWPKHIQDLIPLNPEDMPKLIPLTKAMMSGETGNPAEYFSTDGLNTLGYGNPKEGGDEHAPSHSVTRYNKESKETHLANYYLETNEDFGNGYFYSTSQPELEDNLVLNTTDGKWKLSKHKWEVKDIDLEAGKIVLNNPYNTFVSRTPTSEVHDVAGKSIHMYLKRDPHLGKTWGHLIDHDAVFAEGSKIHKLTVTNNNEVFLLPNRDECTPDDGSERYATVTEGDETKQLCNFVLKHEDGDTVQATSFQDIFVTEFSDADGLTEESVDGVIVGKDGSSYLIAQLKRTSDAEGSGNIKFFKKTKVRDDDGDYKNVITEFPTSIPASWREQTIAQGDNEVDLCRVTVPTEVLSFGRDMKMPASDAFLVTQGEGSDRALRSGQVLLAGMTLPEMPHGLNEVALDSLLSNINVEKFKTHEHKEFYADELCHAGNSLMKDKAAKDAYPASMKTSAQYHDAVKQCESDQASPLVAADVEGKEFTLSQYDEDQYRKIKLLEPDSDGIKNAKIFKDVGASVLYEYDGTYLFDDATDSVKVTFTNPEDGKKYHTYLSRIKNGEADDDGVSKQHFKTLHILEGADKGAVAHQIYFVKDLPAAE